MGRLTLNPIAHIDPFGTHPRCPLLRGVPPSAGRSRCPSTPPRFRRGVPMARGTWRSPPAPGRSRTSRSRSSPPSRWAGAPLRAEPRARRRRRLELLQSLVMLNVGARALQPASPSRRSTAAASRAGSCRPAAPGRGTQFERFAPFLLIARPALRRPAHPDPPCTLRPRPALRASRGRIAGARRHDDLHPTPHRRLRHAPHRPPPPRPPPRRARELGAAPGGERLLLLQRRLARAHDELRPQTDT